MYVFNYFEGKAHKTERRLNDVFSPFDLSHWRNGSAVNADRKHNGRRDEGWAVKIRVLFFAVSNLSCLVGIPVAMLSRIWKGKGELR